MSGYVMAMGHCITCGRVFSFNPEKVPSTTVFTGAREPVCQSCIDYVQERRREMGLPPFHVEPDAYEPLPEEELSS